MNGSPTPGTPLRLTLPLFASDGRLVLPDHRRRAGQEVLRGQLSDARALLTNRPDRIPDGPTGLPADFERMRRFHLPPACLEQTRSATC